MKSADESVRVSSPQKIVWNTVFSTFSELSMLFTSVFFFLAASRLGKEVWGQFTTALAFVGLFAMLIIFGFSYSITKVIVRKRLEAGSFISNALLLQVLLTFVTLGLCYGAALVFKQQYALQFRYLILIAFAAESLKSYTLTLRAAAKALGGFHYDTIAMNAERLLLLGVGGALLIAGRGVYVAASVLAATRLVSFLILLAAVHRLSPDGFPKPTWPVSRMLISESWIYVVQSALWRVYDYIDVVMISLLVGWGPAGLYGVAKKILEGLWLIPNILTEAMYPEIAARHLVSGDLVRRLFGRSLKYLTVTAFVVAIGTVLMAGTVVGWFGDDYRKAAAVLVIFGIAVVPSYLRYMFGNTLIAVNLQKKEIMVSAARSIFNIGSNYVLISRYGILGAAAATVATDVFAVVLYWILLKRAGLVESAQLAYLGKPFAAIVPLIPVYWLVHGLAPALQCAVMLPIYGIFIVWFRLFQKEEAELFRKSIQDKWRTYFTIPGLPKSK